MLADESFRNDVERCGPGAPFLLSVMQPTEVTASTGDAASRADCLPSRSPANGSDSGGPLRKRSRAHRRTDAGRGSPGHGSVDSCTREMDSRLRQDDHSLLRGVCSWPFDYPMSLVRRRAAIREVGVETVVVAPKGKNNGMKRL